VPRRSPDADSGHTGGGATRRSPPYGGRLIVATAASLRLKGQERRTSAQPACPNHMARPEAPCASPVATDKQTGEGRAPGRLFSSFAKLENKRAAPRATVCRLLSRRPLHAGRLIVATAAGLWPNGQQRRIHATGLRPWLVSIAALRPPTRLPIGHALALPSRWAYHKRTTSTGQAPSQRRNQ